MSTAKKAPKKSGGDDVRHVDKPIIVADHVSRWYGQIVGVNDLTVEIGRGITGLLGPNGAGKSTLLKMMVGQLRPSRGTLTVRGEHVWKSRAVMRWIGYCPEHESNYDELTGLEFVSFMTELHGFSRQEAKTRAAAALAKMDLTASQDRLIGEYSKGMRQRAKLAQVIAHDPEVVFLDEPLTGCDPIARNKILAVIKELGEHACVIVSSHVLHEIESMTTEILLINKGQILAEGNVYEIREMIDRHPHRIRVECDRPRDLAAALLKKVDIKSVGLEEGAVIVETQNPDACYPEIPRVAKAEGVKIAALTSPDNNLGAVFKYLTEERSAREATS